MQRVHLAGAPANSVRTGGFSPSQKSVVIALQHRIEQVAAPVTDGGEVYDVSDEFGLDGFARTVGPNAKVMYAATGAADKCSSRRPVTGSGAVWPACERQTAMVLATRSAPRPVDPGHDVLDLGGGLQRDIAPPGQAGGIEQDHLLRLGDCCHDPTPA